MTAISDECDVEHQSVEAIDFMPRRPKWSRKGDAKETSKNRLRLREEGVREVGETGERKDGGERRVSAGV